MSGALARLRRIEFVTSEWRGTDGRRTERRELGEAIASIYSMGYEPVMMSDEAYSSLQHYLPRIYGQPLAQIETQP